MKCRLNHVFISHAVFYHGYQYNEFFSSFKSDKWYWAGTKQNLSSYFIEGGTYWMWILYRSMNTFNHLMCSSLNLNRAFLASFAEFLKYHEIWKSFINYLWIIWEKLAQMILLLKRFIIIKLFNWLFWKLLDCMRNFRRIQ